MAESQRTDGFAEHAETAKQPDGPEIVKRPPAEALETASAAPDPTQLCSGARLIETRSRRKAGNITKRTHTGEALQVSEARYRRLFEAAQDGILILDAETGLITDVNPFLVKLLGYSHEEFLGKELWEIGLFKDIEASKSAFRELQTKHYVRYQDLPLETKGGRPINVEFV